MDVSFVLQVPVADQIDLRQLTEGIASRSEIVESRPFDGETVVQALVVLSASTYPYFKSWMASRREKSKHTYVSIDGMRLRGFTAQEVVRISREIEHRLGSDATKGD
jgi:hypothetical protein